MGASRSERQGDENDLRDCLKKRTRTWVWAGDRDSRTLAEHQSKLHTLCTDIPFARLALLATLVGHVGSYAKYAAESTTQHTHTKHSSVECENE